MLLKMASFHSFFFQLSNIPPHTHTPTPTHPPTHPNQAVGAPRPSPPLPAPRVPSIPPSIQLPSLPGSPEMQAARARQSCSAGALAPSGGHRPEQQRPALPLPPAVGPWPALAWGPWPPPPPPPPHPPSPDPSPWQRTERQDGRGGRGAGAGRPSHGRPGHSPRRTPSRSVTSDTPPLGSQEGRLPGHRQPSALACELESRDLPGGFRFYLDAARRLGTGVQRRRSRLGRSGEGQDLPEGRGPGRGSVLPPAPRQPPRPYPETPAPGSCIHDRGPSWPEAGRHAGLFLNLGHGASRIPARYFWARCGAS